MKKYGAHVFKITTATLCALTLVSFCILLFKQLPTDNLHYGYGVLFYSFLVAPFIILPLMGFSFIGAFNYRESNKKHSVFYLTCLGVAIFGLILAIALLTFKELYRFINLNPQLMA